MSRQGSTMDDGHRLEAMSSAIDAEGPEPTDPTPTELRFRDEALTLRRAIHAADAELQPPDLSTDILDHLDHLHRLEHLDRLDHLDRRTHPLLATAGAAAAVFAVAGLLAVLALRPGGPAQLAPAAADVGERILDAQHHLTALDATVELIERNVHPDVPERHLTGTLRYRAPEQLWLVIREPAPPAGWPANDLELVLDEGTTWRSGLAGCPVGSQPGCLQPRTHATTGLAPFSEGAMSAIDLVMPVHAFLPELGIQATHEGDLVVIVTTVARIDRLVDGLTTAGAVRGLHPTDQARLELDASSLTLRRLAISAADNLARSNWAATHGYQDSPGETLVELSLDPDELAPLGPLPPPPPRTPTLDAGFRPEPSPVEWPVPDGFAVYRTGTIDAGGPRTTVVSLSAGRAWIRIDRTDEWDRRGLFGGLGPLVREVEVGDGVGYLDLDGTRLALRTPTHDLVITGSVSTELLVEVGAALEVGRVVEGAVADHTPDPAPGGVLVPPGEHLIATQGDAIIVGVPGSGRTGMTITHRRADHLRLPSGSDLVETRIRGTAARYDPRAGAVRWIEGEWSIELRSEALDLDGLSDAAELLVPR